MTQYCILCLLMQQSERPVFSVFPSSGSVPPQCSQKLTVTAFVDDCLKCVLLCSCASTYVYAYVTYIRIPTASKNVYVHHCTYVPMYMHELADTSFVVLICIDLCVVHMYNIIHCVSITTLVCIIMYSTCTYI